VLVIGIVVAWNSAGECGRMTCLAVPIRHDKSRRSSRPAYQIEYSVHDMSITLIGAEGFAPPMDMGGIAVMTQALPDWRLDAIGEALRELDVGGIEPTVGPEGHLSEHRSEQARAAIRRLRDRGLTVCGLAATNALPLGSDGLRRVVELAGASGAPIVRAFAAPFAAYRNVEAQLEGMAKAWQSLCGASSDGVRVLVEPAQGTLIPSAELARRVLDAVDSPRAGVVYDPANMAIEGHLPAPFALGLLAGFVGHVHVKNHVLERRAKGWGTLSTCLADGLVDWPGTLRCLGAVSYAGWLSIDHLAGPATADQLEADVEALRALIDAEAA
jgi:sugar phosphate isomerase/epimerase